MSDLTDCTTRSDSTADRAADSAADSTVLLPTRQKNALRLLLGKSVITPEEVAVLDYRVIERAPGVGKKSIEIIRAWLHSHGHELAGLPVALFRTSRAGQRKRKLERAIDYLRGNGYEVLRSR